MSSPYFLTYGEAPELQRTYTCERCGAAVADTDLHTEWHRESEPCTCSKLSNKTDHRCDLHPDVRARTPDQRFDFEHAFDARIKADAGNQT